MQYCTPESVGVPSEKVLAYYQLLEEHRLNTHDVYLARGNSIFSHCFWKPFEKDQLHRMYSVTKSFVSLAVGFAQQDGLLSLDDPVFKYFPEESKNQTDPNMRCQTIRNMLTMSTAKLPPDWVALRSPDRVLEYFENTNSSHPAGTIFRYDSEGSFIMGALVERLTGKPFLDYLREKCLDKIGFSKDAHCLLAPGGHSWGDSALLCRPYDLLLTMRFVANGGSWNGEQLLNREYIQAATSKQVDTNMNSCHEWESNGYGYQIWLGKYGSYFFNGMGCQYAMYMPETDMILVYNGDNQGRENIVMRTILDGFYDLIVKNTGEAYEVPEDAPALTALRQFESSQKLMAVQGDTYSPMQEKIDGKTFICKENRMGITKFRLDFGETCTLRYTNAQGDKTLHFKMCENAFENFPQTGYAKETSSVYVPGHPYRSAHSGAWVSSYQLHILAQIIDEYLGQLNIRFGFREDGHATLYMEKVAEDFLQEYSGWADCVLEA